MTVTSPASEGKAVATSTVPGWLLSFVAGNVDVLGFAALFGLFTAHVTGNSAPGRTEPAAGQQPLLSQIDCGFNRSMQRFDGIVQRVYRSLVFCAAGR